MAGSSAAKRRVCLFGLSADPPTGTGGHVGIVRKLSTLSEFDEIRVLPVYRHTYAVSFWLPVWCVLYCVLFYALCHVRWRTRLDDIENTPDRGSHESPQFVLSLVETNALSNLC